MNKILLLLLFLGAGVLIFLMLLYISKGGAIEFSQPIVKSQNTIALPTTEPNVSLSNTSTNPEKKDYSYVLDKHLADVNEIDVDFPQEELIDG